MEVQNEKAAKVIELLDLEPHPEGGAFKETFRSELTCKNKNGETRNVGTAIYFLIEEEVVTRWHRVLNDEVWHFYRGDPLVLELLTPDGEFIRKRMGPKIEEEEIPQLLIPENTWQRAYSTGDYTLVGCTVAPGFDFEDYEEINPDDLSEIYPDHADKITARPFAE